MKGINRKKFWNHYKTNKKDIYFESHLYKVLINIIIFVMKDLNYVLNKLTDSSDGIGRRIDFQQLV